MIARITLPRGELFVLTTDHPESHFGTPILMDDDGDIYDPDDFVRGNVTAAEFVEFVVDLAADQPDQDAEMLELLRLGRRFYEQRRFLH